jgi:hypothetical protein
MRKPSGVLIALAVGALACSAGRAQPARPAAGAALPPSAFRVEVAEIVDRSGFGQPMVAARVLVPAGWRTQGGVQWATRPCQEPATFAWSAVSPDGRAGVDISPAETWAAGSNGSGDCAPGAFRTVREYLEAYVQRRAPGARVLDYRPRPDFMEANKDYYDASLRIVNGSGTGVRAWVDAGEALYAFQRDGVAMRGTVAAVAMFYGSELANPLGGPPLWSLTGGAHGVFGAYAPDGQLDFAKVESIRKSVKADVAWTAEMMKLTQRLGDINVRGTRERAAIIVAGGAALTQSTIAANQLASRNYADVRGPGSASGASNSATDDRIQRERLEVLRGVETYHDPVEGGTVQLDNTFGHAWRVNNEKAYILTNDPNFNPGLYQIDAQQLGVVQ